MFDDTLKFGAIVFFIFCLVLYLFFHTFAHYLLFIPIGLRDLTCSVFAGCKGLLAMPSWNQYNVVVLAKRVGGILTYGRRLSTLVFDFRNLASFMYRQDKTAIDVPGCDYSHFLDGELCYGNQ